MDAVKALAIFYIVSRSRVHLRAKSHENLEQANFLLQTNSRLSGSSETNSSEYEKSDIIENWKEIYKNNGRDESQVPI